MEPAQISGIGIEKEAGYEIRIKQIFSLQRIHISVIPTSFVCVNAGVDINGYQPVTFYELMANNQRWKKENGGIGIAVTTTHAKALIKCNFCLRTSM